MKLNLPPKVRATLYVLTVIGTPIIAFLNVEGYINEAVVNLWFAETTVIAMLAAFNTDVTK